MPVSVVDASAILELSEAPVCSLIFVGALTYSVITLQKPTKSKHIQRQRRNALALSALLFIINVAQGLFFISASSSSKSSAPDRPAIVHVLGSILTWGSIGCAILEQQKPVWNPYVLSWLTGGSIEIALLVLHTLEDSKKPHFAQPPFDIIRIVCFILLLFNALLTYLEGRAEAGSDEERHGLLGNEGTPNENGTGKTVTATNGSANYGSFNKDDDDDSSSNEEDEDDDSFDKAKKKLEEQQRKRLEEHGGWIGYLKSFSIFLPHIWPSNDLKGKLAVALLIIILAVERVFNIMVPRQLGIVTNKLAEGRPFSEVSVDLVIWVLLVWLNAYDGIKLVRRIASDYIQYYSYRSISNMAFSHVLDLSMDFHADKDSGEVIRSVSQANALNGLFETLLDTLPVFLDICVGTWYVAHLFDVYLSFCVITASIVFIWSGLRLTSWARPYRRVTTKKQRAESKTLYQSVSNWQTITYFNRGSYERGKYREAIDEVIISQWASQLRNYAAFFIGETIMIFAQGAAALLAVWEVTSGRKPVGNFVTLIMYWDTFTQPLWYLSYSWKQIVNNLIDAERLLQLLNTKPSVADKPEAPDLDLKTGKVEFDTVDFHYDERKPVLKDISFTADSGKTVALVGETGGGKSTTLKLLSRFYDVTGGAIRIDGQDLRSITQSSLREALGVVPQDPSLFNESIYENIRYARLDATNEEIQEACKAAAVHDKIMTFPDGYKSKVGERGVKLSGGELQRVAIARVLVRNPKIVLLDEATSAVDSSTEQQIQEAFRKLSTGRTTLVIAHRLSTIREADLILVIDHGEVVERGTHDELLAKGGRYLELWTKQTTGKSSKTPSEAGDKKEDLLINDFSATATPSQELAAAFAENPKQADSEGKSTEAPVIKVTPAEDSKDGSGPSAT